MSGQTNEMYRINPCEKPLAGGKLFYARGKREFNAGRGARRTGSRAGFTLVETLISILIIAMFFSTILLGYTRAEQRAQWSGYSLAAQAQSLYQLEEFRSVLWDTLATPVVDNTTNIPAILVLPLDLPISGTNVVYATNYATVTAITNSGGSAVVKMIVVKTVWPWNGSTFTNMLVDYRAPDQ